MKIGDKVRFLNDIDGGTIAGFQGKEIVLVEDKDGFQIPTQVGDVVVVDDEDYGIGRVVEKKAKPRMPVTDDEEDYDPSERPVTYKPAVEERKDGDRLCAYLAFVPLNAKEIMTTRFEAYFVNDSNYYMRYVYLTADGANWQLRSTDEVEPNTKLFIEEFGREDLNGLEHVCVQILAYKRDKSFVLKSSLDVRWRIDPVKFYKLHTFRDNDFFEQPALVYTIVENDRLVRPLSVDPGKLQQEMMRKASEDISHTAQSHDNPRNMDKNAPFVVDLHAGELLETTAGMTPADILNYQLETFRNTLKLYEKKKGKKIIFIHGKGEGVLRHAIVNELRYRYKNYAYQDASFQEYGYGATQVTIK